MSVDPATPARRRYTSERRARQAAQTRLDVLQAAVELFATTRWAGTTLTAIAARAGVAVETVYSGFGSKKALLRAAIDVAVVGDAEPVPLAEREDVYAPLRTGPLSARVDAMVRMFTTIHERASGVWQAITEAAAADAEVDGWRREIEAGRRVEVAHALETALGRPVDDEAVDVLWALLGPEAYERLTVDLGLTREQYERRMRDAVLRLAAPRPRR